MPDKKKSKKLKLSKESRFKPLPLARKALANRLYSTISPDVYGDAEVVKEKIGDFIQGTPRGTTQDQFSEDAWAKYLGLEQPGGSITRSEHRPSVAKNKRAKYHRLPDEFEQQLLQGYQQNKEYIQFEQEDRSKMPMSEMMMPGSSGSVLGNFTVGEGIDEKTGQRYLSYYDKYDIAPNPAEGVMGTPFEFYNRINLPDEKTEIMKQNGGSLADDAMSQFALAVGGGEQSGEQLNLMGGLPEYGFGSWLKDNAVGILKGASSLVGNIPIVGDIASGVFDLAGSVVGSVQQNKADKLAAETEQGRLDEEAASVAEANRMTNLDLRQKNVVNQNQRSYSGTFEQGGDLGRGLMDNTQQPAITEYSKKANTHGDGIGGIPVDAKGNPATVSNGSVVGLTEAGEVTWNGYVFSDKLKVNKK